MNFMLNNAFLFLLNCCTTKLYLAHLDINNNLLSTTQQQNFRQQQKIISKKLQTEESAKKICFLNFPVQASDKEKQWVVRASVLVVGLVGTSLANVKNSIITFWFLGSEVAYVLIFPQLVCVLFCSMSNAYGVVAGLLMGLVVRLLNGDAALDLLPVFYYPGCSLQEDGTYVQCAPVRTISMLSSLVSILIFSKLTNVLFERKLLPEYLDVFKVKTRKGSPSSKEPQIDAASQSMVNTSC